MAHQCHNFTIDDDLALKTAGAVASTASGASLSGGVASLDIGGAANSYQRFAVVIDWTACEVDSGNEFYQVLIEGATTTGFATTYRLANFAFGHSSVNGQPTSTPPSGRKVLFVDNHALISASDGNSFIACRYIRLSMSVSGAGVTTGMNLSVYVVPMP